jgi:hypothetical protein
LPNAVIQHFSCNEHFEEYLNANVTGVEHDTSTTISTSVKQRRHHCQRIIDCHVRPPIPPLGLESSPNHPHIHRTYAIITDTTTTKLITSHPLRPLTTLHPPASRNQQQLQ